MFSPSSILMVTILTGCSTAPENAAEPTPTETPSEAPASEEPATAEAPEPTEAQDNGRLQANPGTGSSIQWTGAKITKSHSGNFGDFTVYATMEDDALTSLEASIELVSVTADSSRLAEHLRSEDFFHVQQYTTSTFTSSSIETTDTGTVITGVLDLHGVENTINFPVTVAAQAEQVHVSAAFSINRQDWGIAYPGRPDDLIKDDVEIALDIKFPR